MPYDHHYFSQKTKKTALIHIIICGWCCPLFLISNIFYIMRHHYDFNLLLKGKLPIFIYLKKIFYSLDI